MNTSYDYIIELGQRVKKYRLAARMSQKELAAASGVSLTTIQRFEQGRKPNLTLSNFISLLRAMGQSTNLDKILPELPISIEALEIITKLAPKRKRKS